MKKLLAIVISMAMIVAMMPMGVFAAAHDTKDDNCVASIVSADTTLSIMTHYKKLLLQHRVERQLSC